MSREIEILIELKSNFEIAKKAMEKFEFKGDKRTVDTYYYDPLRENLKLNAQQKLMECCRIREKAGRCYVAYKIDRYENDKWLYSEEYETGVVEIKAMQKVFSCLGLKKLVTVDNLKTTFETDDYEIVLEKVEGLGCFLEVEYIDIDEDQPVQDIKKGIFDFIKSLGLEVGDELNSGKPELILLKRQVYQQKALDLSIGKILAKSAYSEKKYFSSDFIDEKSLIEIINEQENAECQITDEGKIFLKEYYGLEVLAEILADDENFCLDWSKEKLLKHLEFSYSVN